MLMPRAVIVALLVAGFAFTALVGNIGDDLAPGHEEARRTLEAPSKLCASLSERFSRECALVVGELQLEELEANQARMRGSESP